MLQRTCGVFLLGIVLAGLSWGCASNSDRAPAEMARTVEVKIGDSPANASTALNHDVSVAALESGRNEFEVDGPGGTHRFRLTASQIGDLLNGGTVMTTTSGSEGLNVSLRMMTKAPSATGTTEEPQDSGW